MPPPPRRPEPPLPPLNAMRVFEAAARHLSFTRAAAELSVTQTAVSHQVRELEGFLGTPLFLRGPRRVTLTKTGEAWARELHDVFDRLREAARKLAARASKARPVVAVTALPSFAARWLVPRLGRFVAAHPDVDVRISPTEHLVDFAAEEIDLGVRYGAGRYPGLVVEKLADDALVVVCSPRLLANKKLMHPSDLARVKLLHDDDRDAWSRWLAAHRVRGVDASRGSVLVDSSMVVVAAVEGQGVALARRSLALDDLASGRLVLPFPRARPMPTERSYWIAAPREALARPEVAAFRDWLRAEAAPLR